MNRDERAWTIFYGILYILVLIDLLVVYFFILSPLTEAAVSVTVAVWNTFTLTLLLFERARKKRLIASDRIRIDLGLAQNTFWPIISGILILTMAISRIIPDLFTKPLSIKDLSEFVLWVSLSIIWIIFGFDKWIATDSGIFHSVLHIRWSKIRSYEWKNSKTPVFTLKIKDPGLLAKGIDLEVPHPLVNRVEDLLSQHVAKEEREIYGN